MAERTLEPFSGWPNEAFRWFADLEANNNKAWFQANRSTYDTAVRGPLESLLAELQAEFGDARVTRPNRDIRFSADKSPYKTQIYAIVGGDYYVQLRAGGMFAGGGLYLPDRSLLEKVRAAMADESTGSELADIVAGLEGGGIALMEEGALKTAPRGYSADHPRIRFLRLPHLAAGAEFAPAKWMSTPEAKERIVDVWRRLGPLLAWTARVG